MLANISPNAKDVLLKLLNRTWTSGVLPMAVLVPVLKKDKNVKASSSYRPILLTSMICKTIERMVNARLVYYPECNPYLDKAQAGLRQNMTTTDQLGSSKSVSKGLPQGSALSCTLFLCYMIDMIENEASETRLAYADYLILWQHGTNVEHAADALTRDLALLKEYCAHWKMSINTTKTVYSVFSKSNQYQCKI
ncbi:RNA directed DNA polymerase from mobile element [Plakobranchus ocellatus]|uniref:RNA directed DNA polymerase from mobile element n=1 Tax=Plakobranchus ocellatus TaxID=259542 RepID=A0AAV4B335_9GAST|nr:RNA directed DNA polymerase from mobile element [Plakobranchus ocellatus]